MNEGNDPAIEPGASQVLGIPLLSDEEYRARGIERPRLPPFETWSDEQKASGRKLGEILATIAAKQAYRCVLRQLELLATEGYCEPDAEKEAARRALHDLHAGKWKAEGGEVSGLQEPMCWVLESIIRENDVRPLKRSRSRRTT